MKGWGEAMRARYGKTGSYREADFSINYLGYGNDLLLSYGHTLSLFVAIGLITEVVIGTTRGKQIMKIRCLMSKRQPTLITFPFDICRFTRFIN